MSDTRVGSAAPDVVFTDPSELSAVFDEWRDLATRTPDLSYFASPDWVTGWWETLGAGTAAEIAIWRDAEGALEAVVALARVTERFHMRAPGYMQVWVNLGSGEGSADHCGWAVAPGRRADVRGWLEEKGRERTVILKNFDIDSGAPLVPNAARGVYRVPCPRVRIPGDGEELSSSSGFRKTLRRYGRKLQAEGIGFRWVPPEEISPALVDELLELHRRRREHKGASTGFTDRRKEFLLTLIERGTPNRGPAAVVAERDGIAVGILFGFIWGDTFYHYQGGWDPAFADHGLGTMLPAESIRLAGRAGAKVFDFLRGEEWYKYRFGAEDRVDETFVLPSGPLGELAVLKFKAKARLDVKISKAQREPPS